MRVAKIGTTICAAQQILEDDIFQMQLLQGRLVTWICSDMCETSEPNKFFEHRLTGIPRENRVQ